MPLSAHTPSESVANDWHQLHRLAQHAGLLQRSQQSLSRQWLIDQATASTPSPPSPLWRAWIASRLHLPAPATAVPEGPQAVWDGWLRYGRGEVPQALARFDHAWHTLWQPQPEHWCPDLASAALGVGKCLTRTGHWHAARGWLLAALAVARRVHDETACVQGYGALGELLLRGEHLGPAFACLNTAYHLLPAGSGQRARQLNYLGSALHRMGQPLRAESLLMTSLHSARDRGDRDSQWHALARLQRLALDKAAPFDVVLAWPALLPPEAPPAKEAAAAAVALGHLSLGRAHLPGLPRLEAAAHAAHAVSIFRQGGLVMEHCWATHWHHHLERIPATATALQAAQSAAGALMQGVMAPAPPSLPTVLDDGFARLPLGPDNGFAGLLRPADGLDQADLSAMGRLFFL